MPVVFRPITPKAFKVKAIIDELEQAALKVEQGMVRDFYSTFEGWSPPSQPTVKSRTVVNPSGGIGVEIDVEGEIYELVHEGTRPYPIRARRARVLRFQSGYTAKTTPGRIRASRGGPSGSAVYRRQVMHPGFRGRQFSRFIAQKWRPLFNREMKRRLARGARKSRHRL